MCALQWVRFFIQITVQCIFVAISVLSDARFEGERRRTPTNLQKF
jgi:hypothetical protein